MKGSRIIGGGSSDRKKRERRVQEEEIRVEYRMYGPEIFRLAMRSLRDRQLSEEVVQETFVKAWKAADRFDSQRGSRRTWLFSIARNLIVDTVRARASRPQSAGELEDYRVPDADPTEAMLKRMQIEDALGRISEDHRHVIREVHLRGRPYSEVAGDLGVSPGTLRSRMFYALKSMRLALDEMEEAG